MTQDERRPGPIGRSVDRPEEPRTRGRRHSHVTEDQGAVERLMMRPETYAELGLGFPEQVERIDTHGAMIFLAGEDAFKIKRAVRFSYLDLSTRERRQRITERELELNRPQAPDLYLGLVPIVRRESGALALGGKGEPVEWALHMRRFPAEQEFDRLADAGRLTPERLDALAQAIVAYHEAARPAERPESHAILARIVGENRNDLAESGLFDAVELDRLDRATRRALAAARPRLERRHEQGLTRRCHGDLHLRNIVLLEGRPTLFDALEFDEDLATIDVLYDLAFLLMDLWVRELRVEANRIMNRYAGATALVPDPGDLGLLPLFMSIRAAIRAKVAGARAAQTEGPEFEASAEEARRYLAAAEIFLLPAEARLIAVGGLSGTGKTTLARALAPLAAPPPGALVLRSDLERKRLFGREETDSLPAAGYREDVTARVYAALRDKAAAALQGGISVIADAVHARPQERQEIARAAAGHGFDGLWLEAPAPTLIARVERRRADASDATAAIVERQLGYDLGHLDWSRLEADGAPERVARKAARLLGLEKS